MKKLEHDLLTNKYTEVLHEKDFKHNAPHRFEVFNKTGLQVGNIKFQEGPIKECGVICRLEHFNQSEFRCRENSMAITKLEEALL